MPDNNVSGRKAIEYEIHDVKVSLKRARASVILTASGAGMVHLTNFPFDPAGEQTEDELEKLALKEAKEILKDALKAL